MPEIPINHWSHTELYPPEQDPGMDDFLQSFPVPAKMQEQMEEEEKTPEQLRLEAFHQEGLTYRDNFAGSPGPKYALAMDEVCRFERLRIPNGDGTFRLGPRAHTVVGRHCPHGMLETMKMQEGE